MPYYRGILKDDKQNEGRREKPPELTEALFFLTRELHALHTSISNIGNNAILNRIAEMEHKIMSKLSDQLAAIKAFQDETATDIDGLVASADAQSAATTALSGDIDGLAAKILELQNSPVGGMTTEDQVLLDETQSRAEAVRTKVKAAAAAAAAHAAALQALDEKTPPVVPVA